MWRCPKTKDRFTQHWKEETKSITLNVKKACGLGKKIIKDRQLNRRDHRDENQLLGCFQNIDKELANVKRRAVYFLSPNLEVFERRNEQIELYGAQLKKHQYIIKLQRELMELRHEQTNQDRWLDLAHEDQDLIQVVKQPSEYQFEEIFVRQTELMRELKQVLVRFDQELVKLRRQVEEFQDDLRDQTTEEEDVSVEDLEESVRYRNSKQYKRFKNNVFAQYYAKAKQRAKQKSRQNRGSTNEDLNMPKRRKQKSKPNKQEMIEIQSAPNTKRKLTKGEKKKSKHKQIDQDNQTRLLNDKSINNPTNDEELIRANFGADEQKTKKPKQKKTKNKKVKRNQAKFNNQNPMEFEAFDIDQGEEQLGSERPINRNNKKYSGNEQDNDSYDEDDWFEEELTKQGLSVMQTCLEWMCIKFSGGRSVVDKSTMEIFTERSEKKQKTLSKSNKQKKSIN